MLFLKSYFFITSIARIIDIMYKYNKTVDHYNMLINSLKFYLQNKLCLCWNKGEYQWIWTCPIHTLLRTSRFVCFFECPYALVFATRAPPHLSSNTSPICVHVYFSTISYIAHVKGFFSQWTPIPLLSHILHGKDPPYKVWFPSYAVSVPVPFVSP